MKQTKNPAERLEELIAKVELAEEHVRTGRRVDIRALDAESETLYRQLKNKPDAALQPLLMRAISALERLTATLEAHVEKLKTSKN